jgi:hypothetical protein
VRLAVLIACLAIAVAAVAGTHSPPAKASCGGVVHYYSKKRHLPYRPPLAIGDSVMLGAVPQLTRVGYEVDTRGCRMWNEGLDVLRSRQRAHTLPHLVVMALGANWSITKKDVWQALSVVGKHRVLGIVTPRELGGGSGSDAVTVRTMGAKYPTRIVVMDWVRYSAGHSGWFYSDGLHLTPSGAVAYGHLFRSVFRYAKPSTKLS